MFTWYNHRITYKGGLLMPLLLLLGVIVIGLVALYLYFLKNKENYVKKDEAQKDPQDTTLLSNLDDDENTEELEGDDDWGDDDEGDDDDWGDDGESGFNGKDFDDDDDDSDDDDEED